MRLALERARVASLPRADADDLDAYHAAARRGGGDWRPGRRALVLDEFDHVRDPLVASDLEQLLQSAGERLSIVLASRVDPAFRRQRLRLSGLLAELRARDLAFTVEESAELFARHGVSAARRPTCACSGSAPKAGRPASA